MRATRLLETCLYVDDLDAAETFYRQVLGLERFSRAVGRHVFFRCGDGVFLLFNPTQTQQPTANAVPHGAFGPGHVAFAIEPEELPGWREQLQRHDVAIEWEHTWPSGGQSLYFRDPAGNSVELATPATWQV